MNNAVVADRVTDKVHSRHKDVVGYRLELEERLNELKATPFHARNKAADVTIRLLEVELAFYRNLESELIELLS